MEHSSITGLARKGEVWSPQDWQHPRWTSDSASFCLPVLSLWWRASIFHFLTCRSRRASSELVLQLYTNSPEEGMKKKSWIILLWSGRCDVTKPCNLNSLMNDIFQTQAASNKITELCFVWLFGLGSPFRHPKTDFNAFFHNAFPLKMNLGGNRSSGYEMQQSELQMSSHMPLLRLVFQILEFRSISKCYLTLSFTIVNVSHVVQHKNSSHCTCVWLRSVSDGYHVTATTVDLLTHWFIHWLIHAFIHSASVQPWITGWSWLTSNW